MKHSKSHDTYHRMLNGRSVLYCGDCLRVVKTLKPFPWTLFTFAVFAVASIGAAAGYIIYTGQDISQLIDFGQQQIEWLRAAIWDLAG